MCYVHPRFLHLHHCAELTLREGAKIVTCLSDKYSHASMHGGLVSHCCSTRKPETRMYFGVCVPLIMGTRRMQHFFPKNSAYLGSAVQSFWKRNLVGHSCGTVRRTVLRIAKCLAWRERVFQGLWWVSSVSVELGKDREILIGKRNKKISSPRKGPTAQRKLHDLWLEMDSTTERDPKGLKMNILDIMPRWKSYCGNPEHCETRTGLSKLCNAVHQSTRAAVWWLDWCNGDYKREIRDRIFRKKLITGIERTGKYEGQIPCLKAR